MRIPAEPDPQHWFPAFTSVGWKIRLPARGSQGLPRPLELRRTSYQIWNYSLVAFSKLNCNFQLYRPYPDA